MKCVYAGSFDPFTVGHYDIYKQAKEIFDEVILVIANNPLKVRKFDAHKMDKILREKFGINVVSYGGLVADYCRENGVNFLVRGIRNTTDYLYEENVAKINQELFDSLKTIYFRATFDTISSSMVNELYRFGKDVSKYLPYSIKEVV